mmetsp:Transcript_22812/g.54987  ORF Transcript_22812/g.54987 Transcript_22812/m.54987 type:complete len:508 (-) Transcript_22812:75-1598(-)
MVRLSKNTERIAVLSISLIAATSAFVHPSSRTRQQQFISTKNDNVNSIVGDRQCSSRRHHLKRPLFVQSKDSVFVAENDTASVEDDDDEKMLLVAQDLTKTLELEQQQQSSSSSSRETDDARSSPVLATSDDAAIYFGNAPVVSSDGALVAEEGLDGTGDGLFWKGVVVMLCALWASNFACAKIVMSQPGVDASLYAVARFSVAALSLLPGSINAARKGAISWETARGALVCGSWVAFGYLGQLIGLMTTTPSRACVICSLNCIFVAIVAELMRVESTKERGYDTGFDLRKLIPALIAVAGVAIIELKGAAGDPTVGDLICFAQPIGFGMGYLQLEELMKKEPSAALPVSAIKLAVVAAAACLFFESSPHAAAVGLAANVDVDSVVEGAKQTIGGMGFQIPDFSPILASPVAMGAIAYTGLVTTSLALWVESVAFQRVAATDASIILTTEPLFAAAISAALVGETFGASDAVGAFFIVGACIYAIRMGDNEEVCDEETKTCELEELQ